MYFTSDSSTEDFLRALKGFRRFLNTTEGSFIYHVERMDRWRVPSFCVGEVSVNGLRFVYEKSEKRLHLYSDACYFTSAAPFDLVRMCVLEERDREALKIEMLQGFFFIFRYRMLFLGGAALHAAALQPEGDRAALAFMGFSGAGKSTQAELWKKYQNAFVLNYDKPAVFLNDGAVRISGTPWSGKEFAFVNRQFPLRAIVFPEKASRNAASDLTPSQGMHELLQNNLVYPLSDEIDLLYVENIEKLAECVPAIRLECTRAEESVRVLYEHLYKKPYIRCEREGTLVKIKPGFMLRNIADEWVVIARGAHALNFSATLLLNETGAFLWSRLNTDRTVSELVDEMLAEYDVDKATAERDVRAFVAQMREAEVVDLSPGECD